MEENKEITKIQKFVLFSLAIIDLTILHLIHPAIIVYIALTYNIKYLWLLLLLVIVKMYKIYILRKKGIGISVSIADKKVIHTGHDTL